MQIDRILYPVTTLGPGERLVIWTVGCSRKCPKCANPELWRKNPDKEINVFALVSLLKNALEKRIIDGITITGGEPFEQSGDLSLLLPLLKGITNDVLLYTGYTLEELCNLLTEAEIAVIKRYVAVLIDGAYLNENNDNECVLRGSSNQNIIYFNRTKTEVYANYLKMGRKVQNVFYNGKMVSVGIHNRDS